MKLQRTTWEVTFYQATDLLSIAKRTYSADELGNYTYTFVGVLKSSEIWDAVKAAALIQARDRHADDTPREKAWRAVRNLPSNSESLFSTLKQFDLFALMDKPRRATQFLPLAPGTSDAADRDKRWLTEQMSTGKISLDDACLELQSQLKARNYHGFLYACAAVADAPKLRAQILLCLPTMFNSESKHNFVVLYGAAVICGFADDQLGLATPKAKIIERLHQERLPIATTPWSHDLLAEFEGIYYPLSKHVEGRPPIPEH